MPSYTDTPITGPWNHEQLEDYLQSAVIPIRFGVKNPSGYPNICSLWFLFEEGCFWCAVQEDAHVARQVRRDARTAFEVAPNSIPYRGVRGQGNTTVVPDEGGRMLDRLIHRYLGDRKSKLAQWLLSRVETEVALRIEPVRFSTWDYAGRMQDL